MAVLILKGIAALLVAAIVISIGFSIRVVRLQWPAMTEHAASSPELRGARTRWLFAMLVIQSIKAGVAIALLAWIV